jgi:Flp pilus assembly protein TadB
VSADRPWGALLALAAALLLWSPASRRTVRRARALVPPAPPEAAGAAPDPATSARRRRLLAAVAGLAAGLLVGGSWGLVTAAGAALGVERLLRRGSGDGRDEATALTRDLPGACDLIAVCLAAGTPVGVALAAVGTALPPPLGPHLRQVAALQRLGAEPRRAWADVPPELAALGRVHVRAGESGAAAAPGLRALAADSRAAARAATEMAVHRAGVWILAPLGVCFLPAFLCLGVVPLVLGIAGEVFG